MFCHKDFRSEVYNSLHSSGSEKSTKKKSKTKFTINQPKPNSKNIKHPVVLLK